MRGSCCLGSGDNGLSGRRQEHDAVKHAKDIGPRLVDGHYDSGVLVAKGRKDGN